MLSGVYFLGSSDSKKAFMSFSYVNSAKTDPCLSATATFSIDPADLELSLALSLESYIWDILTPLPDGADGSKLLEPLF